MKVKIAAITALIGLSTNVFSAEKYTSEAIANIFLEKDQQRGVVASDERKQQLVAMTQRAAAGCHNNLSKGQEAENVGNMIVATRKMLDDADIYITHYELLDVVYSILGDNQKNWDCASVLSMYQVLRKPSQNEAGRTHLTAYKVIQAGRDAGLMGAVK